MSLYGELTQTCKSAYTLDALGRVTAVTDRNGNTQSFTYDAGGWITKVTDKNGNETAYTYDGNGNIVKTTDALGNESVFVYNANDQLVSMDLHRVDGVNGADEHQVTLYEYDGRNLVTKEVNAAGGNTLYVYDDNGNMISKTDADGYVTEYTYNSLDLVSHISYNGAKEVTYQYNKVGELVKMDDWLGTTTFELDLLNQLKKVTDHKGNVVEYTYDEVGNQTNLTYPDKTTVSKSYDVLGQLTQVTDAENEKYTYTYDDAGNVTKLVYPNGWVEEYTYDAEGNLLKTVDTDPFHNNKKSTKYEYTYDAEGNLVSEYKRDTTASNRPLTTTYGYDALNRLISAHEEGIGVNTTRTYQYDTLGNLIREEQDGCIEYKYNGAHLDESTKCGTIPNSIGTAYWDYTYDGRGNLVSKDKYTRTTTGMDWQNEETYVYDETNRLVQGKNEEGEVSLYTYNGLGIRVGRELIMKDNTHGYTDFHDLTPSVDTGIDKPEVAVESYVVDYTTATRETLTMHEEGGFDYRWVYGLDKLSVKITSEGTNWWGQNVKQDILKDCLHQDRLGSTTNLTDKFGRVVGRADYNEWGEITYKDALDITSSYRRIWPQSSYTGHDWDDVLGMYYAKARFYDPDAKRFVTMDTVKGEIVNPLSLVPYVYCVDNPLRWVDPLGLERRNLVNDNLRDGIGFDGTAMQKETVTPATNETQTPARKQIATIPSRHIETTPSTPSVQQNNTPVPSGGYQEPFQCSSNYGPVQSAMIMGVANATDWFERTTNNAFNAALELGQNVWETEVGYVKQTWDSLRNGDWEGFTNSLVNSVTLGGWDATIDGMNRRYAEYQENPSVYNTLNRFSLGLVDTFSRVFSPESYGIEANSVEHWQAFYGALLTEAFVLETVKITSTSIENAITDPHSPAGLSNVANSPENVAMSQAVMRQVAVDNFIRTQIPENFQANVREAFASDIKVTTLTEDLVVYRYYGGTSQPSSYWYTPYQYTDPKASLALPPQNAANNIATSIIPAGTTVLEGHVAPMPQWGQPGGGYQIYVPDPSVVLS